MLREPLSDCDRASRAMQLTANVARRYMLTDLG
jgi:hypothetical protein